MIKHGKMTLKRYLAAVMALVMLVGVCPLSAFAVGTGIEVTNVTLSHSTVELTDANGESNPINMTVTAELAAVPAGFDGTEPFRLYFKEQIPEYQHRGYDDVYASWDATLEKWVINGTIPVTYYWPAGTYVLDKVTYGAGEDPQEVTLTLNSAVTLVIDRSAMSDNTDPAATGISFTRNDSPINYGDTLRWEDEGTLQVRVAVSDTNALTGQGNMILRNETTGAEYEHATDYVYTEITDDSGNVTGFTREMVLSADVTDLEPGVWHIEHFTIDDVYGNYVFYNYNGTDTDTDGATDGDDDLLDGTTFTVTTESMRLWTYVTVYAEGELKLQLLGENNSRINEYVLTRKGDSHIWYAWVDNADLYTQDDQGNRVQKTLAMRAHFVKADDSGEFTTNSAQWDGVKDLYYVGADTRFETYDPNADYGGSTEDDGDSERVLHFHGKDNFGNLYEMESMAVGSGDIDLNELGVNFNVEPFIFPGDAGELVDKQLAFVGWWVQQTDQVITAGSGVKISTNATELHLYPVYEKAPVRLQAHYVGTDGNVYVYTEWFEADYTDTVDALAADFTLPADHTTAHTFETWEHSLSTDTTVLKPDVEGAVCVAAYVGELYYTINYGYTGLLDLGDGLTRPEWIGGQETVFVDRSTSCTEADMIDYFQQNILPSCTIAHGLEQYAVWNYQDWETSTREVSNGNCYGIDTYADVASLMFFNTGNTWGTENGLYMELLDDNGAAIAGSPMYHWGGSLENAVWYAFFETADFESHTAVKVYCGADDTATTYTDGIALIDGDYMYDMVILDAETAPEGGVGQYGAHPDWSNNEYLGYGNEGGMVYSGQVLRVYDVTFNGDPNANITVALRDNMTPDDFEVIHVEAKLEVSEDYNGDPNFDIGFGPAGTEEIQNGFGAGNMTVQQVDGVWTLSMDMTMDYFLRPGTHVLTVVYFNNERVQTVDSYVQYTLDRTNVTDNTLPVVSAPVIGGVTNGSIDQDAGGQIVISIPITDAHGSAINDEELVLATDDPSVPENRRRFHFRTTYNADTGAYELTIDAAQLYAAQWYIAELQFSDEYGNAHRYHYEEDAILQGTEFTVADTDGDPYGKTLIYFFNMGNWMEGDLYLQLLDENSGLINGNGAAMTRIGETPIWYAWVSDTDLYSWVNGETWNKTAFMQVRCVVNADNNEEFTTPPAWWNGDWDMYRCDPEGNAGFESYDPNMDYSGGGEGGEGEGGEEPADAHMIFIHGVDEGANIYDRDNIEVGHGGTVDLSDEGIDLSAFEQDFTFPGDAGYLAEQKVTFAGWYVAETGQVITNTDDDVIDVPSYEIHLIPVFSEAPMRLIAYYVGQDGELVEKYEWRKVAYGASLADAVSTFDLDSLTHTAEHTLQSWYTEPEDMGGEVSPMTTVVGFLAQYEMPFITVSYRWEWDTENGAEQTWGRKTLFVAESFTHAQLRSYFLSDIAPTIQHAGGRTPTWKAEGWIVSPETIASGCDYCIIAEYPAELAVEKVEEKVTQIESMTEGSVTVDMNTTGTDDEGNEVVTETATVIPSQILQAAAGKDVDVVFQMQTQVENETISYNWTVNGQNIPTDTNVQSINLKVELNNDSVPEDVWRPAGGEDVEVVRLSIAHNGEFGYGAELTIPADPSMSGKWVNRYYYVPELGKLMILDAVQIDEFGNIKLPFTHASDYVLVVSDEDLSAVAQIDINGDGESDGSFANLADAVAAANEMGGTVTLLQDTIESETIKITSNINLDLGTYDMTAMPGSDADSILFHITTGQLTVNAVTDVPSSGEWNGQDGARVTANGELFRVGVKDNTNDENVRLTVNGGWYGSQNDCCIVIYDGLTTLNGDASDINYPACFYSSSGNYAAIQGSGTQYGDLTVNMATISSENQVGIYWPQNGTLTVNDGSVSGATAIYAKQGTVNINGGSFYGDQDEKAEYVPNGNGCNATGDTVVLDNCGYGQLNVNIQGGYFYSNAGAPIGSYASGKDENGEPNEALGEIDYLLDGFYVAPTGDVLAYRDVSGEEELKEAIAGALNEDGERNYVVRLAADITVTSEVEISSDLVIDGRGHSISGALKRIFKISNGADGYIYVNLYDLTVINTKREGRCVDTRDATISVCMEGCTLTAEGINSQPITVGGPENTAALYEDTEYMPTVDIYLYGTTVNAGNSGYGIIAFVPAWIIVDDTSVINGWNSIYMKGEIHPTTGADTGYVGTTGSYVWIDGTLNSTNIHSGSSNNFGAIVLEDSGVEIDLGSCAAINVTATGDAGQTILLPKEELATDTTVTVAPENEVLTQQLRQEGYYVSEEGSCLRHYASLDFYAISLTGNIAMEFFMTLTDAVRADENAYMQFTMADGSVIQVPASEGRKTNLDGQDYWVFTCYKAAKEMTEEVRVQFFYNGTSTEEKTYSVAGYAHQILNSGYDQKTKDVVTAMLHYGAYAQVHFGHNTDDLAADLENVDLTAVTADTLSSFAKSAQSDEKVTLKSVSLTLETETTLSLYFELAEDVTGFAVKYGDQPLEIKTYGTLKYVDIEDIPAKELDTEVVLEITYDGLETPFTVSYYPLTYCYNVLNNPDSMKALLGEEQYATLADLVRAMYLYNQAANAYFDTIGEE